MPTDPPSNAAPSEMRPLDFPFGSVSPGDVVEIAERTLLIALPVPFPPGAINAVALYEPDGPFEGGWTIVDTGMWSADTEALWRRLMADALGGRPVRRVVATHHHPDHIGLAGWFQREHGAELWTTRTAWLFARMLQLDAWEAPPPESERFMRRCGYDAAMMERYRERAARNFSKSVAPLPLGFRAIGDGDDLRIGGRRWRVVFGAGHAPDHAVLWDRENGLVVAGDQILPKITPNIGVYPTEPEADPLGDWLRSCARFERLLADDALILPGHGDPFRGAERRLRDVIGKHARGLDRLADHLAAPRTVVECFPALYRRSITGPLEGLATVEAVAHLNRLTASGRAVRRLRDDAVWVWEATGAPG